VQISWLCAPSKLQTRLLFCHNPAHVSKGRLSTLKGLPARQQMEGLDSTPARDALYDPVIEAISM
jgi:hypothetical protein